MSATRRRGPLRAAALLAPVLLCPGWRAGAQTCSPVFRIAFGVGPPAATVLGAWDFDRDGRTDLLLRTNGEVRVARNAGGSFTLGSVLSLGGVAVGDFDGDSILDVVSVQVSGAASSAVFLKGDGAGGFRAASSFQAAAALWAPLAADFDGDGRLDLAASTGGPDVWLYRGDGHGGFGAPYVLRTSASTVSRLYTLDVDEDGRLELLASGTEGFANEVFSTYSLGSGGSFREAAGPEAGGSQCPFDVAIGDVDGDGHADAVAVDRYVGGCADGILTFLARPGGGVHVRQAAPSLWSPVLADFDGDGRADIAAVRGSIYGVPTGLAVQLGDGAGGFGSPLLFPLPESVNRETAALTAADVDGDGRTDLILSGVPGLPPLLLRNVCGNAHERASPGPPFVARPRAPVAPAVSRARRPPAPRGALILALGLSPSALAAQPCPFPSFEYRSELPLAFRAFPHGLWAVDLDGDGLPDLLRVDSAVTAVSLNRGAGEFLAEQIVAPGADEAAIGDFNGDGITDLVITRDQMVRLLLGDGSGGFRDLGPFGFFGTFRNVVAGDVDGDGHLDVAWIWEVGAQGRLAVAFGDGHGGFPRSVTTGFGDGETPGGLRTIDFNGDGRTDLVSTTWSALSSTTSILISNGDGTFARGPTVSRHQFNSTSDAIPVDLNGDGIVDLLAMTSFKVFGWNVCGALLDRKGGVTWSPACQYITNLNLSPFALADFTGDGRADVAFADGTSILVATGDGTGSFGPFVSYPAGTPGREILAADLDGDGSPDILIGPTESTPARWWANACRFPTPHRPAVPGPALPVRRPGRLP